MLKEYYRLTKPGIVYGNLLTTLSAFLYIARWQLVTLAVWTDLFATIIGVGLVIASACVFNNYLDRDIDSKMERTKERALASGAISNMNAIIFGSVLGCIGIALLIALVNILTAVIALIGFAVYVFAYTFSKRMTEWATEIGSIAGATPIVAGYTAASGRFDWAALILFLILVLWQMPHFYSIAMFRSDDYAAAGIPALPLKRGTHATKLRMLLYVIAFGVAVYALAAFGYAGYLYLTVVEAAALLWFWRCTQGFKTEDNEAWARALFFLSLWILLIFSTMLSVALILP